MTTTDMSLDWLLGPQLEAFAAAGFEVIGASASGPHVEAIEARGVRHIALEHATRAMAPQRDALALLELYDVFKQETPDIVHTHNPKPGVYGRLAARAAGVPVVINTVHGLYALPADPLAKRAIVYSLERIAATFSDAELLQNPEDVATLVSLGVDRRKITVLGNGVDLDRFEPARVDATTVAARRREIDAGPDDVVVGAVGRLVWEKGYRELFSAAALAHDREPSLKFVVIGPRDPDKTDAVSADDMARAGGAGVHFLGHRDDVDEWYRSMDVYALASYREGFPRSAMEAAAMGTPIVATDIRGCRQVVDHGRTGLLVPPHDAGRLADAFVLLARDARRRRSMGLAARRKAVEQFDQERVIELTLTTYRERLAAASR